MAYTADKDTGSCEPVDPAALPFPVSGMESRCFATQEAWDLSFLSTVIGKCLALGSMGERTEMSELELLDLSPSHVIFCSESHSSLSYQADIDKIMTLPPARTRVGLPSLLPITHTVALLRFTASIVSVLQFRSNAVTSVEPRGLPSACLACVGNAAGEGEDYFLHVKPPPRCLVIITLLPTTAQSLEDQRHCAVCTGSTTAVCAGARLVSLTRCTFFISWSFEHQVAEMRRERVGYAAVIGM